MSELPLRDVLTFGETMLRFSPPGHRRLAQASTLEVWAAGSESNLAATLRVLGLSVTWASRLPDNALGQKIAAELRAYDIDTHIAWAASDERVGTFYVESGLAPRGTQVVYDRANSAAGALSPADLPNELFETHRHLHVSGITPALSPSCAEAVTDAIQRAKARGSTVSLDVNFRARLWTPEAAARALADLLPRVDLAFCSRDDAARVFGLTGSPEERAQSLRERFSISVVALTAGADGAVGCDQSGCISVPAVPIERAVERLGSGDAFAGGVLAGHLRGLPLESSLRLGVAAAALKRTIPGDMLTATRAEVEALAFPSDEAAWR